MADMRNILSFSEAQKNAKQRPQRDCMQVAVDLWIVWNVELDSPQLAANGIMQIDSYLFCLTEEECLKACRYQQKIYGIECVPHRVEIIA